MQTANELPVAVVGAGQMGSGIAHAFAQAGFPVALVDSSGAQLTKARESIAQIVAGGVKLGKIAEADGRALQGRVRTGENLAAGLKGAMLVVETATENFDVKVQILQQASRVVAPEAIIATNTSALGITELAAMVDRPERFIGMHFFNPVHKMKLVEIIRGLQTTNETVERVRTYVDRLGKDSIVVNESPGFTTSRMSVLLGNEAMFMLLEGVGSAEDIDKALRLGLNHPMGPLELGDLTGWDTRLSVLKHLHQTLGEKYRPCPLILKLVKAGRLGRKVGHGIYKYEDDVRVQGSGLQVHL
jgi:3-hydroxybutyryl-CoA dehydrogenase